MFFQRDLYICLCAQARHYFFYILYTCSITKLYSYSTQNRSSVNQTVSDEDIHPLMALLPNALKRVLSGPMNNDPAP